MHVPNGYELAVLLRVEGRIQAWLQAGMGASTVELSHAPASPKLIDDGAAARGWVLIADRATGCCHWASPHGLRAVNDTHRLDPLLYERR
jgi:hypothetical protein